jgi:hypothetical protein
VKKLRKGQRRPEEAEAILRAARLDPLENYPGKIKEPWLSKCMDCGQIRKPRLANILHNGSSGCICRPGVRHDHPEGLIGVPLHVHSKYLVFADGSIKGPASWITPFRDGHGYMRFNVHGQNQQSVHVAVCTAFHGQRPSPEYQVAHLDGNKENNASENLIWCLKEENEGHKRVHGTALVGERHPMAVLSEDDVRSIRTMHKSGTKTDELTYMFPVSATEIRNIVAGRTWRHSL